MKAVTTIFIAALLAILVAAGSSGIETARQQARLAHADYKMTQLAIAANKFKEKHNEWPARLDQLAPFVGSRKELAILLANPFTRDNPGYEYVRPGKDMRPSETVLLFQLTGGKRDESLNVAYADTRVRRLPDDTADSIEARDRPESN
ncbi:MAG: hypothetical protein N2C12_08410 [Planctomycetales bacterium]